MLAACGSRRPRAGSRLDGAPAPPSAGRALAKDGVLVPALLLLIARDLLLFDPPRVLAWRALHDPRLQALPPALAWLLPHPPAFLDRDPLALLLAGLAVLLAAAYLWASLLRASRRVRAAVLALAAALLVVAPTAGLVAMGARTDRPYGQDGGVVQLPLAIEKILAGQSPYGADYSDSILGKEARASGFWEGYGANPILHHHAYLPGTHLLMLPFYGIGHALFGAFDPRAVTLLAWAAAAVLAARLVGGGEAGLAAAALVATNPLVYWQQVFGANDLIQAALVLGAVTLAARGRPLASGAVLGLACATKQLAWPYAPFLLVHLSGAGSLRDLLRPPALRRLAGPALLAAAVFAVVVAPLALRDAHAFWGDVVVYNVGLPGTDNYPLGGTPGFGVANIFIYAGAVSSLGDYVPFGRFYVLLLPLGVWLVHRQLREGKAAAALVHGSAALLASLFFSRVVHPNYLVLVAVLLPVGVLAARRFGADLAAVPLLLLALAVEVVQGGVLRATWQQAVDTGLLARAPAALRWLLPRAAAGLTSDPLGLLLSAVLAGLALVYLLAALRRVSSRVRLAVIAAAAVAGVLVPTGVLVAVGQGTGVVRAQDDWVAQVASASAPAAAGRPVVEAWSRSFRRDPPSAMVPGDPGSPGTWTLARITRWLGDPRLLTVLAAVVAALLAHRLAPPEHRPLAVALVLVSPAAAVAVLSGSPMPLVVAALLAALFLGLRTRWFAAGLPLGMVAAVVPHALALVGAAAAGEGGARPVRGRTLRGALAGLALAVVPVAWWRRDALFALVGPSSRLEAGLGLWNVGLFWGASPPWAPAVAWVLLALVALAAWRVLPAQGMLARAAAVSLLALASAAAASPHELVLPLLAVALAGLTAGESAQGEGAQAQAAA